MTRVVDFGLDDDLPQTPEEAEKMYDLPPGIISGLKLAENSAPNAVSPKGARGPMQFMPKTWAQYGMGRDITNGPASFDAAARMMVDLGKEYNGDWTAAQAHYNGGYPAGRAVAAGKAPPADETRKYLPVAASLRRVDFGEDAGPKADLAAPAPKADLTVGEVAQGEAIKQSSAATATVKAMAEGIIPAAAGFAAFGAGASAGALAGLPIAALTGPLAPVTEAVFTIGGGLAASLGASYSVAKMQDWALAHAPVALLEQFGMDKETREREQREHPYASMAGSVAASLPFARPGKVSLKTMATMMGLQSALEAGKEVATGEPLDPIKLSIAAVGGAVSAKPTKLGAKLSRIGAEDIPRVADVRKPVKTTEQLLAEARETVTAETALPSVAEKLAKVAKVEPTGEAQVSAIPPTAAIQNPKDNALLGDLYQPLENLAPRREYVGQVQEALGPGWAHDAIRYWDDIASKFGAKGPMPTKIPLQGAVDWLSDRLYTLNQMRQGDRLQIRKYMEKMPVDDMQIARSEAMYHSMADESMSGQARSPEMQRVYDSQIKPLDDQISALYNQIKKFDPEAVADMNPHNPRVLKDTWLTKVARFGEDIFGSQGFGRRAGSLNERTMLALEYEDGTRRVVHRNGTAFDGYDMNQKRVPNIATPQKRINVGDDFVDDMGLPVKLRQATTAEIEAQTGLQYFKDPLANRLTTLAELRSYIREHEFLTNTMEGMTKAGAAISARKVPTAPAGFVKVENHPTLDKYYINERFAEAFKDGLSRDRISGLERINNMAVGSMFWNPQPHLFNAFDHYVNSIGFDWLKPWQYPSIIKDMYISYKDVATLSPDYIKYVNSGMGLQYARVAAEDITQTIMKGIGKQSWGDIAVAWGMHPEKMIGAIYNGSKKVLWGGSDIFMLAAYRHAASAKGMDIMNDAIRNFVEAHNPNYRIPTRIGFDTLMHIPGMPEAVSRAISRGASIAMQSRLFNLFGRYHFGQFKALGQSMHDLLVQTPRSAQTRVDAAEHLAFIAFNLGVVYPFIWDNIAKGLSGNPDAYMRRSGAATIPYTVQHLILGDQAVTKLIAEAYGLPPIMKAITEIPQNRQLFTGQHIWEPGDTFEGQWEDTRRYVTGLLVSPEKSRQEFLKGEEEGLTTREIMSKHLGVKLKPDTFTDEQLEMMAKRAEKRRIKMGREE